MRASRIEMGVTSGTMNAASQYLQDGKVLPANVLVAAITGAYGAGGGLVWNASPGAAGGFAQTEFNNWASDKHDNVWLNTVSSGFGRGLGYVAGGKATNSLGPTFPQSLIPIVVGNVTGSTISEGAGALAERMRAQIAKDAEKTIKK
jgi:hypothetical protein